MSLRLKFLAFVQTDTFTTVTTVMDANCSDIQDNLQYNCTAEFAVGIISSVNQSVEIIQSVNVTVRGPYGSNSSVIQSNQSKYEKVQCLQYVEAT